MKRSAPFVLSTLLFVFFMGCGLLHASSGPAPVEDVSVATRSEEPLLFEPGDFEDPKIC